jgi:hypothetical protein
MPNSGAGMRTRYQSGLIRRTVIDRGATGSIVENYIDLSR